MIAHPESIAEGAEARAGHVVRRHRTWSAFGVVGVVAVAAIAVPSWLMDTHGSAAPAGQPETPLSAAAATCQAMVDAPNSDYTRVLAASATTGAGLPEAQSARVRGDARQRGRPAMDPASRYVVCGFVDPHVVVLGQHREARPTTAPGGHRDRAAYRTRLRDRYLDSAEYPTRGRGHPARWRATALYRLRERASFVILEVAGWRAVMGTHLRHWLITRAGGVYSEDVLRRFDPDWHYAVCALVAPDTARPGPIAPKGIGLPFWSSPPWGRPCWTR